jgi:hypothetical protein
MKQMPAGWELACLTQAIAGAGFRATVHREREGLTFHYGPSTEEAIHVTVVASPGTMTFVARSPSHAFPLPPGWEARANDATIDWGIGRLSWDHRVGAPETATTLFAYPDRVPPQDEVHEACHELWLARDVLRDASATVSPYRDWSERRDTEAFASRFADAGFVLKAKGDGSFLLRFDTGDDGTVFVRVSIDRPGVLLLDGLSPACPEWPDDGDVWRRLHALNCALMGCSVTRWTRQIVIRKAVPTAWIPDHPAWPVLMLDHLSWAAMDVVRIGRGGPIERPD